MPGDRAWTPVVGDLVAGRYRVETTLGQGGMGVVLGARDEKENRAVALKVLQMEGHINLERFLREARLAAKIDSKHVVKVLEVGIVAPNSEQPFLVMERLVGSDFGFRLKRSGGPLPVVNVADCIVQACEALAHAHGAGVIHRDIKASNLFEHKEDDGGTTVKVLDFGISKYRAQAGEIETTLTTTNEGGFLGSPPYMSPEHVRDPRSVDGRSDLWSLGVVAYRLLSGRFPFRGESTGEVLAAILEQEAPSLRDDLGLDVPKEIDQAILRCLSRSREERFPNAAEMAAAFAPFTSARWSTLHIQVADVARRMPAVLVPEPPSRSERRSSRVDAEPATMTVAPPVSVSQHPPAATPSSTVSVVPANASSGVAAIAPRRSPVVLASVAMLVLVAIGAFGFFAIKRLPRAPATATVAAGPSPSTTAPPAVSSVTPPQTSATVAENEPSPPSEPAPTTSAKRRFPLMKGIRPRAATSTSAATPPAVPTKKPDLHPNPYAE
jgi:serine/threonine-protein kinase